MLPIFTRCVPWRWIRNDFTLLIALHVFAIVYIVSLSVVFYAETCIDMNMHVDIHIIINMNIENYMIICLLSIPYYLFPISYSLRCQNTILIDRKTINKMSKTLKFQNQANLLLRYATRNQIAPRIQCRIPNQPKTHIRYKRICKKGGRRQRRSLYIYIYICT